MVLTRAVDNVADAFELLDPHTQRMKDALLQCVDNLNGPSREALRMRYQDRLDLKEMSARLEKTPGSISVLLHRVRTLLRECIERRLTAEGF